MRLKLGSCLVFVATCLLTANEAFSQPLVDDNFDDNDPLVNLNGVGGGVNPTLGGIGTEADGVFELSLTNSAQQSGVLSQDEFTANAVTPLIGTFTFTEMVRPLVDGASQNAGTSRWYAGFFDNAGDDDDDDFQVFGNIPNANGNVDGGLWVAFKERSDQVIEGPSGAVDGDEGRLYYNIDAQEAILLAEWTWDRSVFSFDEQALVDGLRSDRVSQDLLVDLKVELSSDSTGYGLKFFSSNDTVVLPNDISGTWAGAGITDLSSLDTVHAVPFGGQNGQDTRIEIDRLYVDNEPERNADDSGLDYTWGDRPTTVGSWGADPGWQVGGVDTATVPGVVNSTRNADAVQVLAGTVNVDTADQGAWTLQIDNGATVNVASTLTLEIIENVSNNAVNVDAGGNLVIGGTVITPSIGGSGTVTFADGTLRLDRGAIGALATTSDGTISNTREATVGQVTLGAGDTLTKQRAGTLVLDQTGGANSLEATSVIESQFGSVAGVNDASNNAFGSASINVNGGGVTLSASATGSTAFDNAVSVNTSGTIRAAQVTGALASETVTLGGANGVTIAASQTATLDSSDGYTLNVAGAVSGDGTLSIADGANVALDGSVTSAILEFRGDATGVSVGGPLAPTSSYRFVPTEANLNMAVDIDLPSSAGVIIDGGLFDGSVALTGALTYTGATRLVSGTLQVGGGGSAGDFDTDNDVDGADFLRWQREVPPLGASDLADWEANFGASGSGNLPSLSNIQFEATAFETVAVVDMGKSSLEANIGTGAGEFNWVGAGGFAGLGAGAHTVTLEGGSSLNWTSANAGFNGQVLQLNSPSATGRVNLTNDLNLENESRTIEVSDNVGSVDDVAEISGVISSTPGGADVLVVRSPGPGPFLAGHLVLSGANSYTTLEIGESTVEAVDGVGLPGTANLRFASAVSDDLPAIYATSGTFTRNIGTGPGEVSWAAAEDAPGSGGGFAAIGGDLDVTLEGGADLNWGGANDGFNGAELQLGSNVATGVVTLTNNVDGGGTGTREIEAFDNPLVDADRIVLSGNYTNFSTFRVDGDGELEMTGSLAASNNIVLVDNGFPGELNFIVSGTATADNNVNLNFGSHIYVNGSLSVDNDMNANNGESIGGTGTIFMVDTDADGGGQQRVRITGGDTGGRLRPGAGPDSVGTLTIDLTAAAGDSSAGSVEVLNGGSFEMEFENNGGVQNDSVVLTSSSEVGLLQLGLAVDESWTLELEALGDLTGLISGTDEFDVFTWNESVDFAINGVVRGQNTAGIVDNVVFSSDNFDVSGASVEFEVANDFSGRVFVTGLALPSVVAAAKNAVAPVPEPTTCVGAALAAAASLCYRRRRSVS